VVDAPSVPPAPRSKEITMSDFDPKRMDPKRPAVNEAGYAADRGFNWSWIIGGIAAIVVLFVALSFMGGDDRTAETTTTPPAATTGQASPPASPMNPAPRAPNASPNVTPAPASPAPAERTPPPPANQN
jgi:type IV secretory pathway VirB10-like protein